MARRSGLWRASGMSGQRLDRQELRHRLSDIPGWIIDDLADAFEPALLSGLKAVSDRKRKTSDSPPKRRPRQGRPDASEPGDDA